MGERLLCKQEVIGSIPFTSTRAPRLRRSIVRGTATSFRRVKAFYLERDVLVALAAAPGFRWFAFARWIEDPARQVVFHRG